MDSEAIHRLYRVVYVDDPGGWRVRAASGEPASAIFARREDALVHAKRLAEGHGWARIAVHASSGLVEREFIFGSDHRERPVPGRDSLMPMRTSAHSFA